jgi:hypothetical protein
MSFETWLRELGTAFAVMCGWEEAKGHEYTTLHAAPCWREMFDDGVSPKDAAAEEYRLELDRFVKEAAA